MDVFVYKVDYVDFEADVNISHALLKQLQKGKRLVINAERMPLKEALEKKLAFTSTSYEAWPHTKSMPAFTVTDDRSSRSGGVNETYMLPNTYSFEIDHKDSKERELPAFRVLDPSQALQAGNRGPSNNENGDVARMLPFLLPTMQHTRVIGKSDLDKSGINAVNSDFYITGINRGGLVGKQVGPDTSYRPANARAQFCFHDNGHQALSAEPAKYSEVNGVETAPLSALSNLLMLDTRPDSISNGQRWTSNAVSRLLEQSSWAQASVLSGDITKEFVLECVKEFCENVRVRDQGLWSCIVNTMCCCLGAIDKPDGTHYQIGKAGAYILKPSLKGKIKKRDDLYQLLLGDDGRNAQQFTVEEMTHPLLEATWLSILYERGYNTSSTKNMVVMMSDYASISQGFHETFNFITKSNVNHYITDVDGKQYVGYGNAVNAFKDGGIRYAQTAQDIDSPTEYPMSMLVIPRFLPDFDPRNWVDLARIYEPANRESHFDEAAELRTLTDKGLLSFHGTYVPTTNRFTLAPLMHHVTPDPKKFGTESLMILRNAIKMIWPEAKFIGKSLEFTVGAQDCRGDAFKAMVIGLHQEGVVKIDQNLSQEQKSPIFSKNALANTWISGIRMCQNEEIPFNTSTYLTPLGGVAYSQYGDTVLNGEDLKQCLRLHGLKISGTKEEQCRRLAEKFGEIYENNNVRERIAEVIPFDNLVLFTERSSGRNGYEQDSILSEVAQEQLDTVMPKCSPKDSGNVKVVDHRIEFGEDVEAYNKFFNLGIDLCKKFHVGLEDYMNFITVYFMEHTASGAIFRKSHKDSLRTPENLFYEMVSKGQKSVHQWRGIQL